VKITGSFVYDTKFEALTYSPILLKQLHQEVKEGPAEKKNPQA
jgi:hypothetical protein